MKKYNVLALTVILFMVIVSTNAQEAMSESYFQAAIEALNKGNYAEAVKFSKLGLSETEKLRATNPDVAKRLTIRGLNLLSGSLIELKNYAEAENVKREEIELMESIRDQDYPLFSANYPMSLESLGFILKEQNEYAEAEEIYRKALTYREKVFGASDKSVSISLTNLGDLYLKQGKISEAEVMSRRALSILGEALENNELKESDISIFFRGLRILALVEVERKRYVEAEKTYKSLVSGIEKFYGQRDSSLIEPLEEYAKLLRIMKRPIEALRIENRVKLLKR